MDRLTFIQESRVGRTILQVNGDVLEGTYSFLGKKSQIRVKLRAIDPQPLRRKWRFSALPVMLFSMIVLGSVATVGVWWILPEDAKLVAVWPCTIPIALLFPAVRSLRPMEIIFFRNHWGRNAFYIIREPRQGPECDAFVLALVEHIRRATDGEEARAVDERAAPTPLPSYSSLVVQKWPWTVILGTISVIFPNIPHVEEALGDDMTHFAGFLISASGAFLSFMSFQRRERLKYVSLVGAILCLIAPFFYSD